MPISFHESRRLRALVLVALCSAACSKQDAGASRDTAAASPAPAVPASFAVAGVETGRHIGPDKQITEKTSDFGARDTIYASVHTTGTATSRTLAGNWTFENGSVVDQRSETISPTGDAYTEFHIVKPSGWPKGKYTLHVLLDGNEVQSKEVAVK